jgi:Co/Zn/Cd efflux system component
VRTLPVCRQLVVKVCLRRGLAPDGAPSGTDMKALSALMVSVPGVRSVHDVHVWTVTSGFVALSSHVEVATDCDRDDVLAAMRERLDSRFDIRHVTLQVETASLEERLAEPCLPETAPCYATNVTPDSR